MGETFKCKITKNKVNGQLNISLPKKKLPPILKDKEIKSLDIKIEDFDLF